MSTRKASVWEWLGIDPVDVASSLAAAALVLAPAWGALTHG